MRGRVFGLRGFSCYLFAIFKVLFDRVEGFVIVGVFFESRVESELNFI